MASVDERGTRVGCTEASTLLPLLTVKLYSSDLADRMIESPGVDEINRLDCRDRPKRNIGHVDWALQPDSREDRQLRLRIKPIDVCRRVGLSVAKILCFLKGFTERHVVGFHPSQNVVTRTVEDTQDSEQPIARKAFLYATNYWNASGNRRFETQMALLLARKQSQLGTTMCDDLLVRRHHRLSRLERPADPGHCRLLSADQLDEDIHIGCQDRIDIVCPRHAACDPVRSFTLHVAVDNMCKSKLRMQP